MVCGIVSKESVWHNPKNVTRKINIFILYISWNFLSRKMFVYCKDYEHIFNKWWHFYVAAIFRKALPRGLTTDSFASIAMVETGWWCGPVIIWKLLFLGLIWFFHLRNSTFKLPLIWMGDQNWKREAAEEKIELSEKCKITGEWLHRVAKSSFSAIYIQIWFRDIASNLKISHPTDVSTNFKILID